VEISREEFEKLKQYPFFRGVIVSDSMEPLIKVGEKISAEVGNQDLKRFDVVVIFVSGKLICHYFWAKNRLVEPILFQTRDLRYGGRDNPVSFDDYLGKVVSHKLSLMDKIRIIVKEILRSK
jgi:hypothetical protein